MRDSHNQEIVRKRRSLVYNALSTDWQSFGEIVKACDFTPVSVMAFLNQLEITGQAEVRFEPRKLLDGTNSADTKRRKQYRKHLSPGLS